MNDEYLKEFIECTSLSISYDIMGIATVSYTLVRNRPGLKAWNPVTFGNRTFVGYVASIDLKQIEDTDWYENHVTLTTTTTT